MAQILDFSPYGQTTLIMKKQLLVLSSYAVVPPQYSGPIRVYNLCRQLSRNYRVTQFSQQVQRAKISFTLSSVIEQVTPNYLEYSSGNPINIMLFALTSLRWNCPPVWQSKALYVTAPPWLHEQIRRADLVQVESPWQFEWAYRQVAGRKPVVLTAHNVEVDLYSADQIAASPPIANLVMKELKRLENFAVHHASLILTMSEHDSARLIDHYGIAPDKCLVIANGTDTAAFTPVTDSVREQRKKEFGLAGKKVVVFSGSMHRPNIEAVEKIIGWAEAWPDQDMCFLIIGKVHRFFTYVTQVTHPNIRFTGGVDEVRPYLEAADVAINPMLSGSGTSLKQLEFMAMGLPTLATPIGCRGIPIEEGVHGYIRTLEAFPAFLRSMLQNLDQHQAIRLNARALVELLFDWKVIGDQLIAAHEKLAASVAKSKVTNQGK
jgi:glycosyltransferase involved in cell wall biosynthesis